MKTFKEFISILEGHDYLKIHQMGIEDKRREEEEKRQKALKNRRTASSQEHAAKARKDSASGIMRGTHKGQAGYFTKDQNGRFTVFHKGSVPGS
jgi:hypothetical protein